MSGCIGDVTKPPPIMFEMVGDVGEMALVNHGCALLVEGSTGLRIGLV